MKLVFLVGKAGKESSCQKSEVEEIMLKQVRKAASEKRVKEKGKKCQSLWLH